MLLVASIALVCYILSITTYRLFLCPVSHFPGPRLAALTFWYEFYYDVILQGSYTFKIEELHKLYGPIVRINPEELHIDDSSFYDQIYTGPSRKTNKWPWSARMFGTSMAAVGTVDHDIHRQRRAALNPFFSKKSVTALEPIIQAQIDRLCAKLETYRKSGHIVNLSDALACLSADVISDCAFGQSYALLDAPDFAPTWRKFMMDLSRGTHLMKQFSWAYLIIMGTVPWLLNIVHPLSRRLNGLRRDLNSRIESIRLDKTNSTTAHRTFFHDLLTGDLPESEKSTARLTDEALTIIGAGTVTTSHTASLTLFHILGSPSIKGKLQAELQNFYQSQPDSCWTALTQLPYLTAVITEGLRLAFGVSHRLQRTNPDAALQYRQWTIPAGTPVSQTQMFIMTDPKHFPCPREFLPERWLDEAEEDGFPAPHEARKFFVPFSRGTRACVGMNLAYAELYLVVASLMRPIECGGRFEMALYQTTTRDFEVASDWFNPSPPKGSKGLRVTLI